MNRLRAALAPVVLRVVAFSAAWVAITEADASVAGYALAAVPLATAASLLLRHGRPTRTVRPRQVRAGLVLAGWVWWRSIVGGVDVARRALWLPRADIEPYWTTHTVGLRSPAGRTAFALVLNLAPGTLAASLDGDRLDLHVISRDMGVEKSLADLERLVVAVVDEAQTSD